MNTLKAVIVAALLFTGGAASAGDYPTDPEQMDKFCEAIGETPNVAVPPRDRLWLRRTASASRIPAVGT